MKNILWLDDDEIFNLLVKQTLHIHFTGVQYTSFVDGFSALDHLKLCQQNCNFPDLVFVDLKMPEMDGIEFLENYSQQYKSISGTRVYVVTSSIRKTEIARAASFPCVEECLMKPVPVDKLKKIILG